MAVSLGRMVIHLGLDTQGMSKGAGEAQQTLKALNQQASQLQPPQFSSSSFDAKGMANLAQKTGQFKEQLSNAIPLITALNHQAGAWAQMGANIAGATRSLVSFTSAGAGLAGVALGALAVAGAAAAIGKAFYDSIAIVQDMKEKLAKQSADAKAQAVAQRDAVMENARKARDEALKMAEEVGAVKKKVAAIPPPVMLNKADFEALKQLQAETKELHRKRIEFLRQQKMAQEEAARSMAEYQRLSSSGRSVTESLRTPKEVYKDTIEQLAELRNKGYITYETWSRGARKAAEEAQGVVDSMREIESIRQGVGAVSRNSMAGFSAAQQSARNQQADRAAENLRRQQHAETNRLLEEANRQVSVRPPVIRPVAIN